MSNMYTYRCPNMYCKWVVFSTEKEQPICKQHGLEMKEELAESSGGDR